MANLKPANICWMTTTYRSSRLHSKLVVIFAVCLFCYLILGFINDLGEIRSSQAMLQDALLRQSQAYMQQLALFNNTIRSQRLALPLTNPSLNSQIAFPSLRTRGPLYPTIPPLVKQNHSSEQKFITSPMHAIRLNGGLGNQLFELISLIGIGRNLNRQPIIPADNGVVLSILSSSIFPRYPMILDQIQVRFFESYKYFESIRNEVRLWLSPQKIYTLRATMMIPNDVVKRFKICTHIRRGDFVTDGMHLPSDPDFARDATEYLIAKFRKELKRKAVVVVLGNDPIFSHYIFHDKVVHPADVEHFNVNESLYLPKRIMQYKVILTPTLSPEVDLSFSRNFCDVVLITAPSSTFGFWIAYLAKDGAKVFYRDIEQTSDRVQYEMDQDDFFPSDWTKLRVDTNGDIVEA